MDLKPICKILNKQLLCLVNNTLQRRFIQCSQQSLYKRNWYDQSDADDEFSQPQQSNRKDSTSRQNRFSYQRRQSNSHLDDGDEALLNFERIEKPNWSKKNLPCFEKMFYKPTEAAQNRSEAEIVQFREEHKLTMAGTNIPNPVMEFSDIDFPSSLSRLFKIRQFDKPTPIQAQGWPIALSGRDLVGIGQTGSGKTLGYLLPGIIHANCPMKPAEANGPRILVIAPTRELVQQIDKVVAEVTAGSAFRRACVFGGANKSHQVNALRQLPQICIATPGRLLDFIKTQHVNVNHCTYVVLDEADLMLDMGFEPQIRQVFDQLRPDRQTLLWSATWPSEVHQLAEDFVEDPIQLNVGSTELLANTNIKQEFIFCSYYEIPDRIVDLINQETGKVMIFANTKRQVDDVVVNLIQRKIRCTGVHGDHTQVRRDASLDDFRNGRCNVLIATNVASRGLDINDVNLVINFSLPANVEDYVHRIGRTARGSNKGRAVSFFTHANIGIARPLIKQLEEANQEVPADLTRYAKARVNSARPAKAAVGNGSNYRSFSGNKSNNRRTSRY